MSTQNVGVLHPGNMGIAVAAAVQQGGHTVYWASEGRSAQTRERAERFHLADARTLTALCQTCSVIVSVCPPHAAEAVAGQVRAQGYRGLYMDVNAISPQRARRIGEAMEGAGITFVDGGIIGGPAWQPGTTWLHLAGAAAEQAAAYFAAGPFETNVLGPEIGRASALKMCYAAYTKGTTALLCGILTTAEVLGVREDLVQQWSRNGSRLDEQAPRRVQTVTEKAWRFVGEMEEISSTFSAAGLPGGFHQAAADVYRRIAHFKDADPMPSLEEVLSALMSGDEG